MLLRIHRSAENREVIGLCDRELIGKTFTEGEISISVSEAFFGNQQVTEEEVVRILMDADNVTIFGERCLLAVFHDPGAWLCQLIEDISQPSWIIKR